MSEKEKPEEPAEAGPSEQKGEPEAKAALDSARRERPKPPPEAMPPVEGNAPLSVPCFVGYCLVGPQTAPHMAGEHTVLVRFRECEDGHYGDWRKVAYSEDLDDLHAIIPDAWLQIEPRKHHGSNVLEVWVPPENLQPLREGDVVLQAQG